MANHAAKDTHSIRVLKRPDDTVVPEASGNFVSTPYVEYLSRRALAYLEVGYPVHFAGPPGTGKTTIAFHVAAKLGRPVILIHGDDEFGSSDLVGKDSGFRKSRVVDNYVHSVFKTEEQMNTVWEDNRLTTACQYGYTLIYDEFTRSRPEANNALLSVLEERILNLPRSRISGPGYLEVHKEFRAIFTSNPEEYAGIHKTQDALLDRLINIKIEPFDRETELEITMAKSGVLREDAETIVDIVRELRKVGVNNDRPTIRACIAIAKIIAYLGVRTIYGDKDFLWVCRDVLNVDTAKVTRSGKSLMQEKVEEIIKRICNRNQKRNHVISEEVE